MARELTKKGFAAIFGPMPDDYINALKNNKTLKLEFDYDELKGSPRIENPELRGSKNWKEFNKKVPQDPISAYTSYKTLGEGTHIFKGDIDPKHIVGGKGYKKRTLEQIKKYIKNNPKRFGKEAAKVGTGLIIGGYAVKKAIDSGKKKKKKQKEKKNNDNT